MRVLHLHSGNQFGGIERLLVTLARCSGSGAIEHTFGLCFRGRLATELEAAGARVLLFGRSRLARPDSIVRARRRARRTLAQVLPDVVMTHLPWARVVFGPVIRNAEARSVHWVHGCTAHPRWLDRMAERYRPDAFLYNSAFTESICRSRLSGVPSTVLYPPVQLSPPVESRADVRRRYATAMEEVVIIQASRMEAWKGHFDLVDAAWLLPAELPWVIWFAGGPQTAAQKRYYERLQTHVARAGLVARVRFLGELSDMSSVLHAADVFCQPNEDPEPFGIAFVEAMGASLPVVATAIGAAPELLTDATGTLVSAHDPSALSEALRVYLVDSRRRAQAGAHGLARATELAEPGHRVRELARFLSGVRSAA